MDKNSQSEKKSRLTIWILGSIIVAIGSALVFPHFSMSLKIGGEIFLRLLKMMVVPLVITSVMNGILGLGDIRKLGRPGAYTIFYYISTTLLAVIVGLIVVNIIQPGIGSVDQATLDSVIEQAKTTENSVGSATIGTILNNLLLMLVTDNLFTSAAQTNLLPLIVFSIIFAGMLTTMGARVTAFRGI